MKVVEKSENLHIWHVCDVKNVAIYAKFMQFSCGEKLSPKVHLWRKNDKYQVWVQIVLVISLDDLHPENMSITWSTSSNY